MGVYVLTGGTNGIGKAAADILRMDGHEVVNIDLRGGDIDADLGTAVGREIAVSQIKKQCPEGLDGLICNAGVCTRPGTPLSKIVSVNYFGAVSVAEGLYDLLKMKKGNCVITASATIAYERRGKYYVDELLSNYGDETRICRLVDSFDYSEAGEAIYVSTKIALVRWIRRVSVSWAAHGVNINAVAPGAVNTSIMGSWEQIAEYITGYPIPMRYGQNLAMDPSDIGHAIAFLVSPEAKGICGTVLINDGGTDALLNTERYC